MKKSIFNTLLIISTLLITSCSKNTYGMDEYIAGVLPYKENFRILQLSDLHLGVKDNLDEHFTFIDKIISKANADLIVVTGDVFTFANKSVANKTFEFLDSYGIPWTLTFGNHDEQVYFTIDWLTNTLTNYGSNCLFLNHLDDDIYGNANFVIDLKGETSVRQQIYIFDSNRYNLKKFKGYDAIHEDQVSWYQNMIEYTNVVNGSHVPSLAFFHIPLIEFNEAYDKCLNSDPKAIKVELDRWEKNEEISTPNLNTGLFDKMLELGNTKGVFVGHNHENTFCVNYKGIYLGYGIKSTNRDNFDKHLLGGQVISMDASNNINIERIFLTYEDIK